MNGLYDTLCAVVIFSLLVYIGASEKIVFVLPKRQNYSLSVLSTGQNENSERRLSQAQSLKDAGFSKWPHKPLFYTRGMPNQGSPSSLTTFAPAENIPD